MSEALSNRVLTIPNLLTLLRLGCLAPVILLYRNGSHVAAAGLFLGAMLTDAVDGWLARRLDQRSTLGVYLDPVVDKVVVLVLFYELAHAGMIAFATAHLFLLRELLQNAVRNVAAARGRVVGANWMGKTKAFLQTLLIAVGLLLPGPGTTGAAAVAAAAWLVLLLSWIFLGIFVKWNWKPEVVSQLRDERNRAPQPGGP